MYVFLFQTPEDAAKTNGEGDAADATAAAPVTNGTTEESKTNGEAPVATPEESVTPPVSSIDDSIKPIVAEIKEVAQDIVADAILAASKSVDEIKAIAKPEVNAVQDLTHEQTHTTSTQAIETSITESKNVVVDEQSSEKANIDTNTINDNTDTITNSVGLVDCTNNNTNNFNNLPTTNPAPPLPENPPPSQITVFAETAMSVDDVVNQIPQSIPIIDTHIQNDSALVGNTKIELNPETVAAVEPNTNAKIGDDVVVVESIQEKNQIEIDAHIESINEPVNVAPVSIEQLTEKVEQIDISNKQNEPIVEDASIDTLPKPEDIAETIAILDRVNESDVKLTEDIAVTTNTEPIKDDLSADISSPLPQNSLESLPSPQSLSSNVTPPSEIDENTTTELVNEDIALLPPPPPVENDVDEPKIESQPDSGNVDVVVVVDDAHTNGNENVDELLPPPPFVESAIENNDVIDELKTNGIDVKNTNEEVTANGDSHLNGSAKANDGATNDISDKVITTYLRDKNVRIH